MLVRETNIATIKEPALEAAREGKTYKDIAEMLGMSRTSLLNLRSQDPAFKQMLEDAMFDGSTMVVEELRDVPYVEECPQRARVKIEALCRYLELRWPHRYGKRLDVTVRTLDMRSALDKARERVSKVSQVIDMSPDSNGVYTDSQSVDTGLLAVLTLEDLM